MTSAYSIIETLTGDTLSGSAEGEYFRINRRGRGCVRGRVGVGIISDSRRMLYSVHLQDLLQVSDSPLLNAVFSLQLLDPPDEVLIRGGLSGHGQDRRRGSVRARGGSFPLVLGARIGGPLSRALDDLCGRLVLGGGGGISPLLAGLTVGARHGAQHDGVDGAVAHVSDVRMTRQGRKRNCSVCCYCLEEEEEVFLLSS